jgi:protoporphyrinogen oxidase
MTQLAGRKIVILGAGPTGLGAAHRLKQIGLPFSLYERSDHAGGLASSYVDPQGFTWDIGGHVQFSHYRYFDQLMDELLGDEWLHHQRESWVWMLDRFIPYPFQRNIHRLPKAEMLECLRGLIAVSRGAPAKPRNFEEWIQIAFGPGIARLFLLPYNFKVWAYPPGELDCGWMGERVTPVDLERIVVNILENRDDAGWGPNNQFRFPLTGGTGEIWRRLGARLPVHYGYEAECIDTARRRIRFANGAIESYDILISTIPLDTLILSSDLEDLRDAASAIRHSSTHVIGVGLSGQAPPQLQNKCWMYFPESDCPFYRATVFSNYSPGNVPDASRYWSLMLEVSESPDKPVDGERIVDQTVDGLIATQLIESRGRISSLWHHRVSHGYPTPFLGRDAVLNPLNQALESLGIYSRGRFGAWRYEVSNQDHSLMQGVEVVNRLAFDVPEMTIRHPDVVNQVHK